VCFAKLPGIHGSRYDGFSWESARGGESLDSDGEKNVLGLSHSFKTDSEEAIELPKTLVSIDSCKSIKTGLKTTCQKQYQGAELQHRKLYTKCENII
jgi:hypothetical protein